MSPHAIACVVGFAAMAIAIGADLLFIYFVESSNAQ